MAYATIRIQTDTHITSHINISVDCASAFEGLTIEIIKEINISYHKAFR